MTKCLANLSSNNGVDSRTCRVEEAHPQRIANTTSLTVPWVDYKCAVRVQPFLVTKGWEKWKGGDGDSDGQADHGETFLESKPWNFFDWLVLSLLKPVIAEAPEDAAEPIENVLEDGDSREEMIIIDKC